MEIFRECECAELVAEGAKEFREQFEAFTGERGSALEDIGAAGPGRVVKEGCSGPRMVSVARQYRRTGVGRRGRKWTRTGRRRASIPVLGL